MRDGEAIKLLTVYNLPLYGGNRRMTNYKITNKKKTSILIISAAIGLHMLETIQILFLRQSGKRN